MDWFMTFREYLTNCEEDMVYEGAEGLMVFYLLYVWSGRVEDIPRFDLVFEILGGYLAAEGLTLNYELSGGG